MRKIYFVFLILLGSVFAHAQCMVEHWSLAKRVQESDVIIHAQIIEKTGFWDNSHSRIYTKNVLQVFQVFKGQLNTQEIVLITEGGRVGLDMLKVNPSLELNPGEIGVFTLKNGAGDFYLPTASTLSFLAYQSSDDLYLDHEYVYHGHELFTYLEKLCGQTGVVIQNPPVPGQNAGNAAPTFSSFDKDTVAAGDGEVLTINGSGFGFSRGNGKVEFKNADYGDGRYYEIPFDANYISWSDKKIEVMVPSKAGSGKVKITNNSNQSVETASEIYIGYAHLNVTYTADQKFYKTHLADRNNKGGLTWQMNTRFAQHNDAVNSFLRSIEKWRCESLINWDLGDNTTSDSIGRDDINVVRWTNFSGNKLGVCYSFWSACKKTSSDPWNWYVKELDIEFDSTYNWYFGTGTTPGSQYDFQSVATHELGHGHQQGHVRNNQRIMHYSIGKGDRKVELTDDDLKGALTMMTRSSAVRDCGPQAMDKILPGDCEITKPKANFVANKVNGCTYKDFTFTDGSEGKINSYTWIFGEEAQPKTATGKGPQTAQFTRVGKDTVYLIVTNDFGSDTASLILTLQNGKMEAPTLLNTRDTFCTGESVNLSVDPVDGNTHFVWNTTGATLTNVDEFTETFVFDKGAGDYLLELYASNSCAAGAPTKWDYVVIESVEASFTHTADDLTITFTNTSANGTKNEWDFGDGNTSNENSPEHTYDLAFEYTVVLTANNTCSEDTAQQKVKATYPASVDVLQSQFGVKLGPVPVNNKTKIWNSKGVDFKVSLYNLQGQLIYQSEFVNATEGILIGDKMNIPGVYQWEVIDTHGNRATGKVVK